jgi:two-component system LytT family sensor kinase
MYFYDDYGFNMTIKEFIFSDEKKIQFERHLIFWVVLCVGFYIQSIVPIPDKYISALWSVCFYFPGCIISVYTCLLYLFPRFVDKKMYASFVAGIVLLSLLFFIINYFLTMLFFKMTIDRPMSVLSFTTYFGIAIINTSHVVSISLIAIGIKFSKNWYLRQKENMQLIEQKIINDARLQKAAIYPSFINHSLENLYHKMTARSPDAASTLLNLSETLSYILYDSDEERVSVEKELCAIQNLLTIEKDDSDISFESGALINENKAYIFIYPLILFSFVHNTINFYRCERIMPEFNLTADIKADHFILTLKAKRNNESTPVWENFEEKIHAVMKTSYSGCYILEFLKDSQVVTVNLSTVTNIKTQELMTPS